MPEYTTPAFAAPNKFATGPVASPPNVARAVVAQPDVQNLAWQTWLFRVRVEDAAGDHCPDFMAPFREVFFFGVAGTFPLAQWWVDGPLAIESPAGPSVYLPAALTPGGFVAHVESAPVGAGITVSLWVDASPPELWMSLTIAAGATSATASGITLAAAAEIPAGTRVYLTVDGVGSTDPGADLTVFLYR